MLNVLYNTGEVWLFLVKIHVTLSVSEQLKHVKFCLVHLFYFLLEWNEKSDTKLQLIWSSKNI